MPPKAPLKAGYYLLSLLAVGAVFLTILWLVKDRSPAAARIIAPVLSIAVMGFALFLARRQMRGMDEVHVASQRYASSAGFGIGGMLALALISIPPVADALIDLVYLTVHATPDPVDRRAVHVAFAYGGALMMVVQALVSVIAAAVWWRRAGVGEP